MLLKKKGSLEISIQAIVIVVLAMTLLGLGLGFIKGMFKNITSTTEDVSEQVRQKVLDDLISTDKKISFPKSEIVIDKGGSQVLTVGIRNKNNAVLNYRIQFSAISGPDPDDENVIITYTDSNQFASWFQIPQTASGTFTLPPADSDVRSIRLSPPRAADTGSYAFTFDIVDDEDAIYAQKDFFIVIRG